LFGRRERLHSSHYQSKIDQGFSVCMRTSSN
jgi:hypothetical protein